MTGNDTFAVCGNTLRSDPKASLHHFQSDLERRARLLRAFEMEEQQLRTQSRVCTWHFLDSDSKKEPSLTYSMAS